MNNYIYGEPRMLDMSDMPEEEFNHAAAQLDHAINGSGLAMSQACHDTAMNHPAVLARIDKRAVGVCKNSVHFEVDTEALREHHRRLSREYSSCRMMIVDEPLQDTQRSFTSLFNLTTRSRIHNDTILKTLTEALGTHVIEVLKRTDKAAEYLANWKVQCRIESDRCVVLRDGVVIAEGFYS